MTVTQIVELSKSRSKVYIDEEFAFVLYKGELRQYKLREGEEITQETWKELLETVLPKRAKLRGMALLKSRPYTKQQMLEKLRQGLYPEPVIREAMEYLMSFGYLNDVRYARDYVEYHCDGKSRKRMAQDLLKKGIEKADIEEAFQSFEQDGGLPDESSQIAEWICKKHYDVNTDDWKQKQKMAAFLYRKGFELSAIHKALHLN